MWTRMIKIDKVRLVPSNKIADKLICQIIMDTTEPKIKTEIDNKTIIIEAITWLYP